MYSDPWGPSFAVRQVDRQVDRLEDRQDGLAGGQQVDGLTDRLMEWHVENQVYQLCDGGQRQDERHVERLELRQDDRQVKRWMGRQEDR
jgi:hypothetical protein